MEMNIMDKFLALPAEKQSTIIDAALISFGTNGYKKASISDIASAAGISKSMVFHYFGTKKELYFYLINYCGNLLINEVNAKFDNSVTDFFDRIMLTSDIELSVMKQHPATILFLKSVYFESNEEVNEEIKLVMTQGEDFRSKIAFNDVDTSKFKDGIDIHLIMKMLMWIVDGFMNNSKEGIDLDALFQDFAKCMNLLKNNFYKEKFL
jgi:AcrR family transcriptional regulator